MRLCLVEDNAVAGLEPLTLTRPAFDLILGATTLGAKLARAFGVGPGPARRGAIVRPDLAAVQAASATRTPRSTTADWLARGPVAVANGRWVPPGDFDRRDLWTAAPGSASATARPPAPGSARRTPRGSSPGASTPGSRT